MFPETEEFLEMISEALFVASEFNVTLPPEATVKSPSTYKASPAATEMDPPELTLRFWELEIPQTNKKIIEKGFQITFFLKYIIIKVCHQYVVFIKQ